MISSAKKIASEPRFSLRRKRVKMILAAEFLAIPSSAVKIASERRCAILVHSGTGANVHCRGGWLSTDFAWPSATSTTNGLSGAI